MTPIVLKFVMIIGIFVGICAQSSFAVTEQDMDLLYRIPAKGKRVKIGYTVYKTGIVAMGNNTYQAKFTTVTRDRTAVFDARVDCSARKLAYGCLKTYNGDVDRLVSKSAECTSGGYGPFKNPKDDMRVVVDVFCKRYGQTQ